ncbi:MAG: hypothetical protein AB1644_13545 [Candidatus Zixiibacteriota bacterium]
MTRKQLIQESSTPDENRSKHLRECEECAESVRLLHAFRVSGRAPLPKPPTGWVVKARSVAGPQAGVVGRLKELAARLTFDSWAVPQPVGVRGQATLGHRRVSFEAVGFLFDMRAERHKDEWRFVAQANVSDRSTGELRADKQVLLPDQNGIYQWRAPRPPKKMTIRIDGATVMLPELKWTRPRAKKQSGDS